MTFELQRLVADVCLGRVSVERATPDHALTELYSFEAEDGDGLANTVARLSIYRKLVRHNIASVVDAIVPRTRTLADRVSCGTFDAYVDRFLAEVGPRTPHLRDVPSEFVAWATKVWKQDSAMPAWLGDFARFEVADFAVGVAEGRVPSEEELGEVDAALPLAFREPARVLRFDWAVHELHDDAPGDPPHRAVALALYRDEEHATRTLELTPLAAAFMEYSLGGLPLGPAMASACASLGVSCDRAIVEGIAGLLSDFAQRGLLLGSRRL